MNITKIILKNINMGKKDENNGNHNNNYQDNIKDNSLICAPINLSHDVVSIGQILNRLIHDLDLSQEIIWMFK